MTKPTKSVTVEFLGGAATLGAVGAAGILAALHFCRRVSPSIEESLVHVLVVSVPLSLILGLLAVAVERRNAWSVIGLASAAASGVWYWVTLASRA